MASADSNLVGYMYYHCSRPPPLPMHDARGEERKEVRSGQRRAQERKRREAHDDGGRSDDDDGRSSNDGVSEAIFKSLYLVFCVA